MCLWHSFNPRSSTDRFRDCAASKSKDQFSRDEGKARQGDRGVAAWSAVFNTDGGQWRHTLDKRGLTLNIPASYEMRDSESFTGEVN